MDWPADKVRKRAVSSLVPSAKNARTHTELQISQIAASITEWGWTMPILVDEDGGIIAGHGRIMAAELLGLDKVPTMVANGWSEAQKRAYVIADNKLALNAGWDMDILATEFVALDGADFDLKLTGFDDLEIKNLRNIDPIAPEQFPEFDESIPTEHTCPKCGYKWSGGA